MTFEELIILVSRRLTEGQIPHALVGGVAASLYRTTRRLTDDIDFAIATSAVQSKAAVKILESLGYEVNVLSKAQLDGGPRHALKSISRSVEALIAGRDISDKRAIGVDLLLDSNPWVKDAVERAQSNLLNVGESVIPTITVEDLIIAKLLALRARPDRPYDYDDIKCIFEAKPTLDLTYLAAKIAQYELSIPEGLHELCHFKLLRVARKFKNK